jgi:cyclopropane-fatty-acyl-phospholipid synthase
MTTGVQTETRAMEPFSEAVLRNAIDWVESGRIFDPLVRWGVRRMCAQRLREQASVGEEMAAVALRLADSPIAVHVDKANEQHYEVPPEFFRSVLGAHLKYSCGYWPRGVDDLDRAEKMMLDLTCKRAQLENGMDILELGCGWGSLTLWMATNYPESRIVAVSNSGPQREHIEAACGELGLTNVTVITADANVFDTENRFDRVVSVEMFEHMRNYRLLLQKISRWLRPEGRLFVHIFSHRKYTYPFEAEGAGNWMGRYFFTGGLMPAHDLLKKFDSNLCIEREWRLDGTHYQRTSNAWLQKLDSRREDVRKILLPAYGEADVDRWLVRWRLFFLACAELFGYDDGREWGVSHYLFRPARRD